MDNVQDVKDWGLGEPKKYTAEYVLEVEPVHANYAEDHREKIKERRRKKNSCIGCFDRLYLNEIPYDAIAKNETVAELGLDIFDYNLTPNQVNRLRQALSTNTNLPWVEIDWKSLTPDQKNVLLNLKHPMVLENFFIHKYDERPLPKACANGELNDVRAMVELIDTEVGNVNEAKDKNGNTGAYLAALNGRDQIVSYLLENGASEQDVHNGALAKQELAVERQNQVQGDDHPTVERQSQVQGDDHRKNFKQNLCDCCRRCNVRCATSCFCMPCVISQIMGKIKYYPIWGSFSASRSLFLIVYVLYYSCAVFTYVPGAPFVAYLCVGIICYMLNKIRGFMREKYNLRGNSCHDCMVNWCVTCCSIVQMAAEVDVENPCSMSEPEEYVPNARSYPSVSRINNAVLPSANVGEPKFLPNAAKVTH